MKQMVNLHSYPSANTLITLQAKIQTLYRIMVPAMYCANTRLNHCRFAQPMISVMMMMVTTQQIEMIMHHHSPQSHHSLQTRQERVPEVDQSHIVIKPYFNKITKSFSSKQQVASGLTSISISEVSSIFRSVCNSPLVAPIVS